MSNEEIRKFTRENIKGNYVPMGIYVFLTFGLAFILQKVWMQVKIGAERQIFFLSAVGILQTILQSLMHMGFNVSLLQFIRGEKSKITLHKIFYAFSVLRKTLPVAFLYSLISVIGGILLQAMPLATNLWILIYLAIAVSVPLIQVCIYMFSMVEFLVLEYQDKGVKDIFCMSKDLMKDSKMELFALQLSYTALPMIVWGIVFFVGKDISFVSLPIAKMLAMLAGGLVLLVPTVILLARSVLAEAVFYESRANPLFAEEHKEEGEVIEKEEAGLE